MDSNAAIAARQEDPWSNVTGIWGYEHRVPQLVGISASRSKDGTILLQAVRNEGVFLFEVSPERALRFADELRALAQSAGKPEPIGEAPRR